MKKIFAIAILAATSMAMISCCGAPKKAEAPAEAPACKECPAPAPAPEAPAPEAPAPEAPAPEAQPAK